MKAADPQQFRVYSAENAANLADIQFPSLQAIRSEVHHIMGSPIWKALSKHTRQERRGVAVVKGRGEVSRAIVSPFEAPKVLMVPHQWNLRMLLHELAHCSRSVITCTHGPQFTAAYLRLMHDCWGSEQACCLKSKFDSFQVRVAPWWEPGSDIPVPEPFTLKAIGRDEGAEADVACQQSQWNTHRARWNALCRDTREFTA